jgi:hypothetical protein
MSRYKSLDIFFPYAIPLLPDRISQVFRIPSDNLSFFSSDYIERLDQLSIERFRSGVADFSRSM